MSASFSSVAKLLLIYYINKYATISSLIYSYLYKFETTDYREESQIKEKLEMSVLYLLASHVQA